ncbi:MAG TPA: SPOR domain-containing protein, partial [Bacteroidota bacterium]|nr:SPOR domain-containing protein [Bacteroidota bacterium]
SLIKAEEQKQFEALSTATVYTPALPETIPGFRVQALLTQDIDEADMAQRNLEQQLPDEHMYMVYDAPYYKIRVGNFPDRSGANLTLRRLVGLGYKDAWIVPDNVLKRPPPKLPDVFIEPKRNLNK